MPAITLRIFFLCGLLNSLLLHFVPKKLISLLSTWFSPLPNTQAPPPPPPSPASSSTSSGEKRMDASELKRIFQMFDRNGDGRITQEELNDSLANLGILIPEEDLSLMIQKIDANNDGCVDIAEFGELYQSIMDERDEEEDMKEAFEVFDQNGDGFITSEELSSVLVSLKQGKTVEDCKRMIMKVDGDGDGRVSYKEFRQMMKGELGSSGEVTASMAMQDGEGE